MSDRTITDDLETYLEATRDRAPGQPARRSCASRASRRCPSTPPTSSAPPSGSPTPSKPPGSSTSRSRRPAAIRSSTATGSMPRAPRRSSSTATTTSSRSIRSTSGPAAVRAGHRRRPDARPRRRRRQGPDPRPRRSPRRRCSRRAVGLPINVQVRVRGRGGELDASHLERVARGQPRPARRPTPRSSATRGSSTATSPRSRSACAG